MKTTQQRVREVTMNRKRWVMSHLKQGCKLYLIDQKPDPNLPSGEKRLDLKCQLIDLQSNPSRVHLKLLEPKFYPNPERLGLLVDELVKTKKGDHIYTSFRSLDSLMSHVYILNPVKHIDPPSLRLAELVFQEMWKGLYSREFQCLEGKHCKNERIKHLAQYRH